MTKKRFQEEAKGRGVEIRTLKQAMRLAAELADAQGTSSSSSPASKRRSLGRCTLVHSRDRFPSIRPLSPTRRRRWRYAPHPDRDLLHLAALCGAALVLILPSGMTWGRLVGLLALGIAYACHQSR